eukprot:TRINITY_DN1231_c0_g4_i1.p1 TRINITY_DN1231_c0_g4~~TRINITY_DN1231_c0_g4_i1.p1  ORF type:complete len:1044 (-),score=187.46 TRINITY_DN1231_c0_g4_i1:128-3259(-)
MPILVRARRGETKEAAEERAKEVVPDSRVIVEVSESDSMSRTVKSGSVSKLIEEYNKDKLKVFQAIVDIRKPWSEKVNKAIRQCETAKNICQTMQSSGGLARFLNPMRLMCVSEEKLGVAFSINERKIWHIKKYYNVVSNLEYGEWQRGSTAGATYRDEVSFGTCFDKTVVKVERSSFCEVRRLGINAGEILGQDMPDADRLAKAMKFPKLRDGMNPKERCAVSNAMKMANLGQNHMTRLVRGVLIALGCELAGRKIKLRADKNVAEWVDYSANSVTRIYNEGKSCAIWCSLPNRDRYASILPHFTKEWDCEGLPMRISNIEIPSDGNKTYVISLGEGELKDVEVDSNEVRAALVTYAQSMACEEVLERAYCVGSIMLLHENWPSISLPASLWSSDLIRPAMATKHEIMRHKRDWTLREAMVVSKYSCDAMGLMIKEMMSSGWEHKTETLSEVVSKISNGSVVSRNEIYRWMIENITSEGSGFLYNLDPLGGADLERIKRINDTSMLKYWYLNEVKSVGGDSLCGAMMCSNYTTIPSSGRDMASARELGVLRQLEVIKKGPLYKRDIRLKNIEVDESYSNLIKGSIKEGKISIVPSGLSMRRNRDREEVEMEDWECEKEKVSSESYDDEGEFDDEDDDEEEREDERQREREEEKKRNEEETRREKERERERRREQEREKEREREREREKEKAREIERSIEAEREEEQRSKEGMEEGQSTEEQSEKEVENVEEGRFGMRRDSEGDEMWNIYIDAKKRFDEEQKAREEREKEKEKEEEKKKKKREMRKPLVPEIIKEVEDISRSGKSDVQMLEAIFESNEEARQSRYWQNVKAEWVRESLFMVENWRKRILKEDVIDECCNLMKNIFPTTSLSLGVRCENRNQVVMHAGEMIGLINTGSKEIGVWDNNNFLVQAWSWKVNSRWLDNRLAQKVSELAKKIFEEVCDLEPIDKDRWMKWSRERFRSEIHLLGEKKRIEADQKIKMKQGKNLIKIVCEILKVKEPKWIMTGDVKIERLFLGSLGIWMEPERKTLRRRGPPIVQPTEKK